ncbi:MAG: hypothetical protein HYV09_25535 [Deltaproteobacteria bacterium]|nr:hypothetical protein [Deltaproteobacteria bacterium]
MRPAQLALPCAVALSFVLAAAPACRRKDDGTTPSPNTPVQPTAEGPAEKAGADTAAGKAKEGAKGAGSAVEKAGEKTKKAGEDLKQ